VLNCFNCYRLSPNEAVSIVFRILGSGMPVSVVVQFLIVMPFPPHRVSSHSTAVTIGEPKTNIQFPEQRIVPQLETISQAAIGAQFGMDLADSQQSLGAIARNRGQARIYTVTSGSVEKLDAGLGIQRGRWR
jgi:hypothetical protein